MAHDEKIEMKYQPWATHVVFGGDEGHPVPGDIKFGSATACCDNPNCKENGCLSVVLAMNIQGQTLEFRFEPEVARSLGEGLLANAARQEAELAAKQGKMN